MMTPRSRDSFPFKQLPVRHSLSTAVCVLAAAVLLAGTLLSAAGPPPSPGKPFAHDVRPGPGVTVERWLSHYLPALAGTPGDTKVYVLDGAEPGGTAVVVGGTHANEIAGIMAATLLVERARVTRGRLVVIPNANNSAVSYTDPERPGPEWIELETPSGTRRFKYGARRTHPDHQGAPDPARYRRAGWTEDLDGNEARNLDRAYPGDAEGTLTERIAAAIVRLLVEEKADIAFDLHEAGPESRLAWMIVANPKNVELGALAVLSLEGEGIEMKLEPSSETFRGLSHREWGDVTKARAFLFETPNPGQVNDPAGVDVVRHPKFPLDRRVGVQLATLGAVLDAHNADVAEGASIELREVPALDDVLRKGLGAFLAGPPGGAVQAPAASLDARAEKAQRLARGAMAVIRSARERRGAWTPQAPYAADLDRAALLGAELTPLVSTLGPIEAKWTATDPRWAAMLVRQLSAHGVDAGSVVLASFSGSFPALNLAVMAAARTLDARVVAVSSVTASTWGATEPGFTWPEMEVLVVRERVLPAASVAVSLGASSDAGRGLDPEGLTLARRIQAETAEALGAEALRVDSLDEAIAARLDAYRRALEGARPAAYVNVGGNHASLGGARAPLRHVEGWITRLPSDAPSGATPRASVMVALVAEGVPALSLLNVRRLAREWRLDGARR